MAKIRTLRSISEDEPASPEMHRDYGATRSGGGLSLGAQDAEAGGRPSSAAHAHQLRLWVVGLVVVVCLATLTGMVGKHPRGGADGGLAGVAGEDGAEQVVVSGSTRGPRQVYQTSYGLGHAMKRIKVETSAPLTADSFFTYGHDDEAVPSEDEADLEHHRHDLVRLAREYAPYLRPSRSSLAERSKRERVFRASTKQAPAARTLSIDRTVTRQKIVGFGGAFTEAAALQYRKLSDLSRRLLLDLYFSVAGLGYTIGRVHMNSCDFCEASYSFDDVAGDLSLEHFDDEVTHDRAAMLPFLQHAQAVVGAREDGARLKVLVSPWSPPAWMKAPVHGNASMTGSADPSGLSDDARVQRAWAEYFVRFIRAYGRQGVPVWAVTVQNEPEFAAPWEACKFNSSYEALFVAEHLGPVLREALPGVKILGFDHNKDHVHAWAQELWREGSPSSAFVDGVAYHWYAGGMDRRLDGTLGYSNLWRAREEARRAGERDGAEKLLIGSEGCNCPGVAKSGAQAVFRAERIAHNMLADLGAGSQAWVDWNLLLDAEGGPNHLGNVCDAPAVLSPADSRSFLLQPMFFYAWHLQSFVPPGSRPVKLSWQPRAPAAAAAAPAEGAAPRRGSAVAGMEVAVAPCEGRARQRWTRLSDGRVRAEDGAEGAALCVGGANDPGLGGVLLVDCDDAELVGRFEERPGGELRLLAGGEKAEATSQCLAPAPGVPLDFAAAQVGECRQRWAAAEGDGPREFRLADGAACLTAGPPALRAGAFLAPDGALVLVVLNEGDEDVALEISDQEGDDASGALFEAAVPSRSIQTYVL